VVWKAVAAAMLVAGLVVSAIPANGTTAITEHKLRSSSSRPANIVVGPDGNLWFAELEGNAIGRMTVDGRVREFPVPTGSPGPSSSGPHGIVVGPDHALWFTEFNANKIGRITTSGAVTNEFALPPFVPPAKACPPDDSPPPRGSTTAQPHNITVGSDNNLWFAEQVGNKIGRITTAGMVTEFPIPTPCGHSHGITAAPDGKVWFVERDGNKIGRIDPKAGNDAAIRASITEFPIPGPKCANRSCPAGIQSSGPHGIAVGPDGNLWFGENWSDRLGRITRKGVITTFPVPNLVGGIPLYVNNVAKGPDGNVWFGNLNSNQIGHIDPTGSTQQIQASITQLALPSGSPGWNSDGPATLVAGPPSDRASVWFTENFAGAIGRAGV